MLQERVSELFEKYLAKTCSPAEKEELAELILAAREDATLESLLESAWMNTQAEADIPEERATGIFESILAPKPLPDLAGSRTIGIRKWKLMAAAAIIILLTAGYFLFSNKQEKQRDLARSPLQANDVNAPAGNRATVTLADGNKLSLDSAGNGQLAQQGNVKLLRKADGQIMYETVAGGAGPELFNTLINPRGSQVINMMLADGSQVWLNAGSSVTYPVAFTGRERKVSVNGEAYFEIAKDAGKPFIINKDRLQVEVLGTRFNVNAYDDENDIRVTLLEGSVKTSVGKDEWSILQPGEQARIGDHIGVVKNIDVDKVMGWKNGLFAFDQSDLQAVMRSISRWYDLEVIYEGKVPARKFGGEISRMSNASKVLKVLEESGVKFRIEGKKLIVE